MNAKTEASVEKEVSTKTAAIEKAVVSKKAAVS